MGTLNLGLGLLHIATGVFFTTTGARKCFMADVRANVCRLFDSHKVPKAAQYAVIAGEFLGGLGLLTGTLTRLASLGLLVILIGAYVMDTWPGVKGKQAPGSYVRGGPNDTWHAWTKLLSNALCTPEAQLIVITATLALTGAGAFSLDALIF